MKRFLAISLATVLAFSLNLAILPTQLVMAAIVQQAKLLASDGAAGDEFGISVALSGDTAVVGAYGDDNRTGAAYVFVRSGTTWSQQQKLTATDGAMADWFGRSVAISGDTIVVGAPYDDNPTGYDGGAVYVFERNDTTWSEQQKLTGGIATQGFGSSVAIDGDTIVVGADREYVNTGAAYIFTRSGGTWSQQQRLTASDASQSDHFGNSVSISGDTTVIGAWNDWGVVQYAGAAYVFTRSGTNWSQQQKLTAGDAAAYDHFGFSVGVSGDTIVVGAHLDDDVASSSGSAYTFGWNGTTWSQQQKLIASDAKYQGSFGLSVDIDGDGMIIGSRNSGAYIFAHSGGTWSQQKHLSGTSWIMNDWSGSAVDMSGDSYVFGAPGHDLNGTDSGTAFVFADLPTLSINNIRVTEGDSGTSEAVFTVTLSEPCEMTITVDYETVTIPWSAIDGEDYEARSGTLTFAPGEMTKTIAVPVIGDTIYDPGEYFKVILSSPTNAALEWIYRIGTCNIEEDDPPLVQASVNIEPDTLNLNSKGKNGVTAYIELPAGYDVNQIDITTVKLNVLGTLIEAHLTPTVIGDYDGDGTLDRMVKFDRQAVTDALGTTTGDISLTVFGHLSGNYIFTGTDIIKVNNPGR